MENLSVELNDLPDEILLIILRKLTNVEVLYSIIGVNKRLSTIAQDSIFSSSLSLYGYQYRFKRYISSLADQVLDRFCVQILPRIHHKIKWLDLEWSSMKRILLATNYPNLYGLGLYAIDVEGDKSLFTNRIAFLHDLKSQISSLVLDFNENQEQSLSKHVSINVFTHIFTVFTNLQYLNFGPPAYWYQRLSFDLPPPTILSSTLLELHVCVDYFDDCLYLLDGRFKQLRTFYVNIYHISSSMSTITNMEKLPDLRWFSLYCQKRTLFYDELILPLLQRMLNLETLDLCLKIHRYEGLVDGNNLKENLINHMTRLNQFTFNVRSFKNLCRQIPSQPNNDMQNLFTKFSDHQIVSCVDYFPEEKVSYCHIYSCPYRLKYYDNITNQFPGGIFQCVREVSLFDERSFEHEFFRCIAQSFPLMEELTVINGKSQKDKLDDDNKVYSIIRYPHLIHLHLIQAHDDYIEQFLIDRKMSLPNNVRLYVDHESLKRVTHHFTRDATRMNCAQVIYICTLFDHLWYDINQFPKHSQNYFLDVI